MIRSRTLAAHILCFWILGALAVSAGVLTRPGLAHASVGPSNEFFAFDVAEGFGLDVDGSSFASLRFVLSLREDYAYDEQALAGNARHSRRLSAPGSVFTASGDARDAAIRGTKLSTKLTYDALHLLRVSHFGMATKARVCPGNSFTPETHVLMADGTSKRIEDVAVGDMVLATDPETGKSGPHTVTALIIGEGEKRLIDIVVETKDGPKTIVATWNHDFWVDDQGQWLRADRLDRGDDLLAPTGERVTVVSTSERTAYRRVHNLTVAGVHSYYVLAGVQAVLVHNDGDEYPSPLPTQKQGKTQRLTNSQAKDLAEYNGFRRVPNARVKNQQVFTDGKRFIVQDIDSHNGGTWKVADSIDDLGSKTTRTATTDALLEPIGC